MRKAQSPLLCDLLAFVLTGTLHLLGCACVRSFERLLPQLRQLAASRRRILLPATSWS